MEEITLKAARDRLGDLVDHARMSGEPVAVTRYGKPVVVVVGVDKYQRLAALALQALEGGEEQQ